jgi:hypothetical protein
MEDIRILLLTDRSRVKLASHTFSGKSAYSMSCGIAHVGLAAGQEVGPGLAKEILHALGEEKGYYMGGDEA